MAIVDTTAACTTLLPIMTLCVPSSLLLKAAPSSLAAGSLPMCCGDIQVWPHQQHLGKLEGAASPWLELLEGRRSVSFRVRKWTRLLAWLSPYRPMLCTWMM